MKRTFSIRYKFLAVTTLLLVFCVSVYLFMATTVFREDKTKLVFDFNKSLVENVASDIETMFQGATEKMRLVAYFFNAKDEKSLTIVRELLATSQEIVFVGGSDNFSAIEKQFFVHEQFSETYSLPADFFSQILAKARPIPFQRLQTEGDAIWNATIENGPALIGYGKSVVIEDEKGKPISHYAVVTYLKADRVLKALTRSQFNKVFIVNTLGEIIAHPDTAMQLKGTDDSLKDLIAETKNVEFKTQVVTYKVDGKEFLAAFSKSFNNNLVVMSRVSSEAAFQVVDQFVNRSLLVGLMVVNLAFIAAIFFSRSLTRPLEVLIGGMKRVADGELTTQIQVKSRDEIALLAKSFNQMIRDLKQSREELEEINRDLESKVKERTSQLEMQNQAVKSAQEALLRTTRLAAVGEIAGRAAHEVLNPLTSILARLEKLQNRLAAPPAVEKDFISQLIGSWRKDVKEGGFPTLTKNWQSPSQVLPQCSLFDEDLHNLGQVQENFENEMKQYTEDTDFLSREAHRIGRIIHSMRSLSVVDANKQVHLLPPLVEEAANMMRDLASQHNIEIAIQPMDADAEVLVDRDELIQALTNLFRNGIHAVNARLKNSADQTPGRIEITLTEVAEIWKLRIVDNGIGMNKEVQQHLFENQFTTKAPGEGTGLGLNISRRFLRAVGGDIALEFSAPQKGSAFLLLIPNHKSSKGAAA